MKDFDSVYPANDLYISEFADLGVGYTFYPKLGRNLHSIIYSKGVLITQFWQPEKYSSFIYALSESEYVENCLTNGRAPTKIRDVFPEFNKLNGNKWNGFEDFISWLKVKGAYFDEFQG